jgi:hypothetical protein
LLLIGAAAWLVRRFGTAQPESASRGRQPRLAVVDFAQVDSRRKLVIIRRDNVEHLLMIGGPSDVVVETNIVRAAANRDAPAARNGADAARTIPIGEPTPWPLQPETVPQIPPVAPARAERSPRVPSDEAWQTPVEPAVPAPPIPEVRAMRPADTLAGLAEDLARPTEPVAVRPVQVQPQRLASTPAAAAAMSAPPATDQSLAEMAQRLEAALRRPGAQKVVTETQRVTATVDIKAAPPKAASQQRGGGTQAQPQIEPPPNNLEQEMASLLSRPGKT